MFAPAGVQGRSSTGLQEGRPQTPGIALANPIKQTIAVQVNDVEQKQRVYLAFQGGGARGIAHIGGLAAINDLGLGIAGVAGTSAGAIIAALIAAGYSAQELLDAGQRRHILQDVAGGAYENPTSLFTRRGWGAIQVLRVWGGRIAGGLQRIGTPAARGVALAAAAVAFIALFCLAPRLMLVALLLAVLGGAWLLWRVYTGLAPLTAVRNVIDAALVQKLGLAPEVTFAALHHSGRGLPLKLVATDVTDQCLELFSFETTPDVVIADAVAASICLPFIFRIWSFDFSRRGEAAGSKVTRRFLDGGLMSNLPAWTFDEERALDPQAVTVAFGLMPAPETGADEKHWLLAAVNAIVAGPPQIHFRGIERMIHIPLDCDIGLLDFNASFDRFSANAGNAAKKALPILQRELTEIPQLIRGAMDDMLRSVGAQLAGSYAGLGQGGNPRCFRLSLLIQKPADLQSFTVAYEAGHALSARRKRVALVRSAAGEAWQDGPGGQANLSVFAVDDPPDNAKIYADSAWMVFVPIPLLDPAADEAQSANLAVVAIIDSEIRFADEALLADFAGDVRKHALDFFEAADFGRTLRRSVSWL
ncbi:hypothetical protein IGB42_04145 [Andreprevotia sp. IGB-42]|uniref:patatin-like phospholipase family protein n=1 Tax=Andreprevotia sp. IGB-42 TaxID=2497473 RepID=UPI0013579C62|nr:patatin-like phospholipase family protein [Andreprevotia sp. IGB-42]KAF0811379.1 hypothetical protein IGB42_04145 [Andreprevotia sp. IGB-42]